MMLQIENERLKKGYTEGCSFSPREIIRKEYEIVETLSQEFNIKYFNTQRLVYSLKYKTPVQYRIEQGFN